MHYFYLIAGAHSVRLFRRKFKDVFLRITDPKGSTDFTTKPIKKTTNSRYSGTEFIYRFGLEKGVAK